ncbi:gliding machinery surface structure protein Gli123 [[Mycoplasma] mobile]|uniref:p123 expressed protein n=2 Tax=[Mycoplasma] mobile TaxID=2118 RepID=F8WJV6_MYCM1|nr:lipoprotein 17-related variable surface protein [[Mycoplasma] mobile]AAT27588.1 P123 expressed protein [Mycoplasma mobile 163K]BAC23067.1 P123 [[Mycoplasma] mobile]
MGFSLKKSLIIGPIIAVGAIAIGVPVIVATTFRANSEESSTISVEEVKNDRLISNINASYVGNASAVTTSNLVINNFTLNKSKNPRIKYEITKIESSSLKNSAIVTFQGFVVNDPNFIPVVFVSEVGGFLFSAEQLKNDLNSRMIAPSLNSAALNKKPSKITLEDLVNPNLNLLSASNLFNSLTVTFSYELGEFNDNLSPNYGRDIIVNFIVSGINNTSSQGSYKTKIETGIENFISSEIVNNNITGTINGLDNQASKAILVSKNKASNRALEILSTDYNIENSYILSVNLNGKNHDIKVNQKIGSVKSANDINGELFLEIIVNLDLSSLVINETPGPSNFIFNFSQLEQGFLSNDKIVDSTNEAMSTLNISNIITSNDILLQNSKDVLSTNWNVNSFRIDSSKNSFVQNSTILGANESVRYNLVISKVDPILGTNSANLTISAIPLISTTTNKTIILGTIIFASPIDSIIVAQDTIALDDLIIQSIIPTFQNSTNLISLNSLPSELSNNLNTTNFSNHFNFQIPSNAPIGTTYKILKINQTNDFFGQMDLEVEISIPRSFLSKTYVVKVSGFNTTHRKTLTAFNEIRNNPANANLFIPTFTSISSQNNTNVDQVIPANLNLNKTLLDQFALIDPSVSLEFEIISRNSQEGIISGNIILSASNLRNPNTPTELRGVVKYSFSLGGFLSTNAINIELLENAFNNLPTITLNNNALNLVKLPGLITSNDFNPITLSNNVRARYLTGLNSITNINIITGSLDLQVELSVSNDSTNPNSTSRSVLVRPITVRNLPTLQNYMNHLATIVKPDLLLNSQNNTLLLASQISENNIFPVNPVFPGTTNLVFNLNTNLINFIENVFTNIQFKINKFTPNDINGSAEVEIELFVTSQNVPSLNMSVISSVYTINLLPNTFSSNRTVINTEMQTLANIIISRNPNDFILFNGPKISTNPSLVKNEDLSVNLSSLSFGEFPNSQDVSFDAQIVSINSEKGTLIVNLRGTRANENFISNVSLELTEFQTDSKSVLEAINSLENTIITNPQLVFNGRTSTGAIQTMENTTVNQLNAQSFSFDFESNNQLSNSGTINPKNLIRYFIVNINTTPTSGTVSVQIRLEKGNTVEFKNITIQGFKTN